MTMVSREKDLRTDFWSLSGSNLLRSRLCNASTTFFVVDPTLINSLGGTKTSALSSGQITGNLQLVTSQDVTWTAANLLTSAWTTNGWTTSDLRKLRQEIKNWVRYNFDHVAALNPAQADANVMFLQPTIGGNQYTIAMVFFGSQGVQLLDMQIYGGANTTQILRAYDGTVFGLGLNSSGQFGNNTLTGGTTPTSAVGGHSFKSVAIGANTCYGVDGADGSLWAWGSGASGAIGNGTVNSTSSPISVLGGRSYVQVVSNNGSGAALDGAGACWAWGPNGSGQLGDGTTANRSSPVSVLGGKTFSQIAAGGQTFWGLEASTGKVWGWGANGSGQLGDGTITNRSSPVQMLGSVSFKELVRGGPTGAFLGIDSTGTLWTVGGNGAGQLGDGTITNRSSPVSVLGGRQYIRCTSGGNFSIAIDTNGDMWAWGGNANANLGEGSFNSRSSPTLVVGGKKWVECAAGGAFSLALERGSLLVHGWGNAGVGQLGKASHAVSSPALVLGGRSYSSMRPDTTTNGGIVIAIEGGTGNAYTWAGGSNQLGALGNGTSGGGVFSPVSVLGGRSFQSVAMGQQHGGGVDGAGQLWMWGQNTNGKLGLNTDLNSYSSPVSVNAGATIFKQLACGVTHSVALDTLGNAWAWGSNILSSSPNPLTGQLGDNTSATSRSSPTLVVGGMSFSKIAVTMETSMALNGADGSVWTWGANINGRLGNGDAGPNNTSPHGMSSPVSVLGGRSYVFIAAGQTMAAIEGSTGAVYCWGAGGSGQCGEGTVAVSRSSPVLVVGGRSYDQVACGGSQVIAREASTGLAWTWGANGLGQLGDGTTSNRSSPVSVLGGRSYAFVAASGNGASFGIEGSTGIIWAWGDGGGGQLGDGLANFYTSPISIGTIFT